MPNLIKNHHLKKINQDLQQFRTDDWLLSFIENCSNRIVDSNYLQILNDAYEYGIVYKSVPYDNMQFPIIRNLAQLHLLKYKHYFKGPMDSNSIMLNHGESIVELRLTPLGLKYLKDSHLINVFDSISKASLARYKNLQLFYAPIFSKVFLALICGLLLLWLVTLFYYTNLILTLIIFGITVGIPILMVGCFILFMYLASDDLSLHLVTVRDADLDLNMSIFYENIPTNVRSCSAFLKFLSDSRRFQHIIHNPNNCRIISYSLFAN